MAIEVRMLISEIGKLREERRNIQLLVVAVFSRFGSSHLPKRIPPPSEIGTLLTLRSKYEAGGMFDPDWWVV